MIRLRYNPRRRANDRELRPWYIWLRGWCGPFKTAEGAVRLRLEER
jgi:hypothetical protein